MVKHNSFLTKKSPIKSEEGIEEQCMSNYIKKRNKTKLEGKSEEVFIKNSLKASRTRHVQVTRSLQELNGFCQDTYQETRQEILADLLALSQQEDITEDIQDLLQGISDYLLESQTCNTCINGKTKRNTKCKSCHGTQRREPFQYNTYKGYMQSVKDFLRYHGVLRGINEKELKISIKKPEVEMPKALETPILKKIILSANKKQLLYHFLATSTCRIGEALSLKGSDLEFIDEYGKPTKKKDYHRIKVLIKAEYAKNKKERFTFVHREIEEDILKRLDKVGKTGKLFGSQASNDIQVSHEASHFQELREKLAEKGIEEVSEKYKTGRSKITLHTFRSWGVTKANRVDYGFGHFIAGHEQYMAIYDRLTEQEMLNMWKKAEMSMSLFEQIPENDMIKELQRQLDEVKAENKKISNSLKDSLKGFDDDDTPTPTPSTRPRPRGKT